MLLAAAGLVALGLFLVVVGLGQERAVATARPSEVDVALGRAELPKDDRPRAGVLYRTLEPVLDVGGGIVRRLSPLRRLQLLRERIVLAGLEGTLSLEQVLGMKAGGAAVGALVGLVVRAPGAVPTGVWVAALAVLGSYVPDLVIGSRATERQREIARALPESLDLLALTVEAGLGLEQALEVVVDNTSGPRAGELYRLLGEIELGVSRRQALTNLRERTDVPELSSFVVALIQADTMGIAIGDVLRSQAHQVRLRRTQRAKEQAAKTPVKILFPLVIGIFPALFVVTVGPAAIDIARSL